jgi:hypothetical protein
MRIEITGLPTLLEEISEGSITGVSISPGFFVKRNIF